MKSSGTAAAGISNCLYKKVNTDSYAGGGTASIANVAACEKICEADVKCTGYTF